jgi:hypothetical protein
VLRGSWQVDSYVVMRNPFIPPVQGPAGSFFNDGLLIVIAGKAADSINADEECDRGKHDLLAVITAQQARAAEALDLLQVPADLSFIMTLVVAGCGLRCPSTPDPRDHLSPFAGRNNADGNHNRPDPGTASRWRSVFRAMGSQRESRTVRVQEKISSAIWPQARRMRIRAATAGRVPGR